MARIAEVIDRVNQCTGRHPGSAAESAPGRRLRQRTGGIHQLRRTGGRARHIQQPDGYRRHDAPDTHERRIRGADAEPLGPPLPPDEGADSDDFPSGRGAGTTARCRMGWPNCRQTPKPPMRTGRWWHFIRNCSSATGSWKAPALSTRSAPLAKATPSTAVICSGNHTLEKSLKMPCQ